MSNIRIVNLIVKNIYIKSNITSDDFLCVFHVGHDSCHDVFVVFRLEDARTGLDKDILLTVWPQQACLNTNHSQSKSCVHSDREMNMTPKNPAALSYLFQV